jgi:hypothetical protein
VLRATALSTRLSFRAVARRRVAWSCSTHSPLALACDPTALGAPLTHRLLCVLASAASGRLIQAREMLQMVLNVERVNDPNWMHKAEPEKTDLQKRAEAAQGNIVSSTPPHSHGPAAGGTAATRGCCAWRLRVAAARGCCAWLLRLVRYACRLELLFDVAARAWWRVQDTAMNSLREQLGKCNFDFSLLERCLTNNDKWLVESQMAQALKSHLVRVLRARAAAVRTAPPPVLLSRPRRAPTGRHAPTLAARRPARMRTPLSRYARLSFSRRRRRRCRRCGLPDGALCGARTP